MHLTTPHRRPASPRDRGASLVEYALLVALVAAVCASAVQQLGDRTGGQLTETSMALSGNGGSDSSSGSGSGAGSGSGSGSASGSGSDSGAGSGSGAGSDSSSTADSGGSSTGGSAPDDSGGGAPEPDPKDSADDPGADVVPDQPKPEAIIIAAASADSRLNWWDEQRKEGEWVARATFTNTWIRHSYLTIEVVRVYANGETSTDEVREFYVPANGTATLDLRSNWIERDSKDSDNVVEVRFKVVQVATSDVDWKPQTYAIDDGATSASEPPQVK